MAAAAALIFLATPPAQVFVDNIVSRELWADLNRRLLPRDNKWFSGMAWLLDGHPGSKTNVVPAGADPIATGSVKVAP
jgi:hypothetical protein